MEAVDPHVEAAVLWLAQTILEVLFAGKMEAWIRQVGLTDDTGRLKSEIERAEAVVAAVKGRAAENRPLARSLGRLKELLYDADDMVDELDYYRLQHQVQGGMSLFSHIDGCTMIVKESFLRTPLIFPCCFHSVLAQGRLLWIISPKARM